MTTLKINVRPRIKLTLTENGLALGMPGLSAYQFWLTQPGNAGKTEDEYFESIKGEQGLQGPPGGSDGASVFTGAKSSAVDAGEFGWISIDDDYVYFCVQTGIAGAAIWKKSVMFTT